MIHHSFCFHDYRLDCSSTFVGTSAVAFVLRKKFEDQGLISDPFILLMIVWDEYNSASILRNNHPHHEISLLSYSYNFHNKES
jgi:hypothetical protein